MKCENHGLWNLKKWSWPCVLYLEKLLDQLHWNLVRCYRTLRAIYMCDRNWIIRKKVIKSQNWPWVLNMCQGQRSRSKAYMIEITQRNKTNFVSSLYLNQNQSYDQKCVLNIFGDLDLDLDPIKSIFSKTTRPIYLKFGEMLKDPNGNKMMWPKRKNSKQSHIRCTLTLGARKVSRSKVKIKVIYDRALSEEQNGFCFKSLS